MASYKYCRDVHLSLLEDKPSGTKSGLEITVADLIQRECGSFLSGPDRMEIQNLRSKDGWVCIDGDVYFNRYHKAESEVDILMGVVEGTANKILIADCKIQMKGGASILNNKNLPDVCANIYDKYVSAKKNVASLVPITKFYIIFNHAVAAVAKNVWNRCSRGSRIECSLLKCFKYECITIEEFRRLVA